MCIILKNKEIIYSSKLKDNTPVIFHLIGPECKSCISKGLSKLSYITRKYRFNSPINKFSNNQLIYLTELDGNNHLAIGGGNPGNCDPGMGLVRYIRLCEKSDMAEIAITIIDEYQKKGLGSILIALIIKYAIYNNIKKFCGYINSDNISMIKLMKKYNGLIIRNEGKLFYFEIDLLSCEDITNNILLNFHITE